MERRVDESLQSYIHNTFPQTDMRRLSYTFLRCILCLACLSEETPVGTYRSFLFLCHFRHACMRKCFTQAGALKSPKRTHSGEKPFECDRCDKCFSEASNLRAHKRTHSGEKLFECDLCGKCFSRDWDLKRHKKKTAHRHLSSGSSQTISTAFMNYCVTLKK